jgi:hypothetical protein
VWVGCITKSKIAVNHRFPLLTLQSYAQKKGGGNNPSPNGNLWENIWEFLPKRAFYGNFWEFLGILWEFFWNSGGSFMGVF